MPNFNQVIVIGHLGADPELRYTGSGKAVCNMRLATTDKYGDQPKTQWHSIVAWGKTAETCGEYLKKGSAVMFVGRIEYRSYDDRDGNTRWVTEIIVERMQFMSGKGDSSAPSSTASSKPASAPANTFEPDDDLPF